MNPSPEILQLLLPAGFEQVKVYSVAITQSDAPARVREREAVGRLLEEAFGPGSADRLRHHPSGAPYIIAPYIIRCGERGAETPAAVNISITHSRDRALLAVAPAAVSVGIDAEGLCREAQLRKVAPRFLSPRQLEAYSGNLVQAWIFKEALYKAMLLPGVALESIPLPAEPLRRGETATVSTISGDEFLVGLLDEGAADTSAVGLAVKK